MTPMPRDLTSSTTKYDWQTFPHSFPTAEFQWTAINETPVTDNLNHVTRFNYGSNRIKRKDFLSALRVLARYRQHSLNVPYHAVRVETCGSKLGD